MAKATCSVDGCVKAARVRGWCRTHYSRWQRKGDPNWMPTVAPAGMKRCSMCKTYEPLEDFNRGQSMSRPCMAAYQREWYARNKDRLAEPRAKYRAERTEVMREYSRAWYEANRERKLAKGKSWREANAEYLAEKARQWRAENPNLVLEYAAKRRAVVRDAWDEYVDRDIVWDRDGGICHICGEPADPDRWDLDHIVPLRPHDGGPAGRHNYGNVAVSHPSCNYSKNNRRLTREQEAGSV